MKKSLTIGIIAIVLVSGCGAVVFAQTDYQLYEQIETVVFSSMQIQDEAEYTRVVLDDATSFTNTPGSYQVPVVTRVFTFPFPTKITHVAVFYSGMQERMVSKPVQLVPQPIADDTGEPISVAATAARLYTTNHYRYQVSAGRDGDQQVTFVSVQLFPVTYNPVNHMLICAQTADITITYEPPTTPFVLADDYDLLIITAPEFADALQPLVDHKIQHNLSTKLVTREDICNSVYFPAEGRDCAEEMKYFIKNAFDQWGIKYVLLVGGRKGGLFQEKWWLPVRYSHLDDNSNLETSYLTDLYFADLYDAEANFSSWDTDGNGVFAEWNGLQKDLLDMYPEVYVGRLPCGNTKEVKIMVEKIITYENTAYGSEWFKKFVGVAGDTYPDSGDDSYEGEMATNASFSYLQGMGFESSFLWTSSGTFTGKQDVIDEVSTGCGFIHFSGHGNPAVWGNHPPHSDEFVNGPGAFEMGKLTNGEKQPVVIVGGCHNSQFNTSLLNIITGVLADGLHYFSAKQPNLGKFWYREWVPRCWAWSMASRSTGGCIAIIANTGLGYGEPGADTLTRRGRFLELLFFRSYSEGKTNLGETHSQELIYYMNEYPPMEDLIDCKIAQQWALLGDPSLQIGGYAS